MTLCDLAFAIVSDLPSYDILSQSLHMSQIELFVYTTHGFLPPHIQSSYFLFTLTISIYSKSHLPS